jgi:hypothetical protein
MFAGGTSLNETRPAGIFAPGFGDNSALFQHAPGVINNIPETNSATCCNHASRIHRGV